MGRNAQLALNASREGVAATVAVAFTKGIFAGISLDGGFAGPRHRVNKDYYKRPITPLQILYEDEAQIPEGSLIYEVYDKLDKLMKGAILDPTDEDLARMDAALEEAERLDEDAAMADDVVLIDARVEAEKGL
jgi:hypothetical protein